MKLVVTPPIRHDVSLSAGNTSGTLALVSTGTMYLAGGDNITLSQNANTITISAAGGGAAGSNTAGMSNLGNTSGTTGVVSGSAVRYLFAGGNNVTLSQSLNGVSGTVTISAFNQTAPVVSNAIQDVGTATGSGTNTSRFAADDHVHRGVAGWDVNGIASTFFGTQQLSAGALISVATGGNTTRGSAQVINLLSSATTVSSVTSANAVGAMASRFALEGHQHAGVGPAGVSTGGNTAGSTGVLQGRLVLAGGDNITLSQSTNASNNMTVTISAAAGGGAGYTAGMSDLGNTAGTTGVADRRLVIVGGAGIIGSQSLDAANSSGTLSVVNSWSTGTTASVVASANNVGADAGRFALEGHQHAGVFSAGVSNVGNTSGNTNVLPGQLVLAGGNNITLSQVTNAANLMTVTVSGINAGAQEMSWWQNIVPASTDNAVAQSIAPDSLYVFPLDLGNNIFPGNMTVSTVNFGATFLWSQTSLSSSFSSTFNFGLYTVAGTRLSLINSLSTSWGSDAGNSAQSSLYHGKRYLSANSSLASAQLSMIQQLYYGAVFLQTSNLHRTVSLFGAVFLESGVRSGTVGVGATSGSTTMGGMPLHGIYSATTNAFPASIGHGQLQKTALMAYFVPQVAFNNILATY